MIKFSAKYLVLTLLLLITEIAIAIFVHDDFVRPYIGDVLVVILIYCFFQTFLAISVRAAALLVLAIAVVIELLQYVNLVGILGLERSGLAKAVLGNSFSWIDILCYIAGIIIILAVEGFRNKNNK